MGLFTTRACNITALNVVPSQGERISEITVALRCDERLVEQLQKQLLKIIDVVDVMEVRPEIQEEEDECLLTTVRASIQCA